MASVAADPAVHIQRTRLRQRLAALRRRLRLVTLLRGGGLLVASLLLPLLVVGALDFRFHLPSAVRALALVASLTGAGVVFLRYLLRPLSAADDDLALALRIEEKYPGLNDSLGSTVQFLDEADEYASPAMRKEAVRRGLRGIEKCDFSRVVDRRGLLPALALALAGVGGVLACGLWQPALAGTALLRYLHPFGGHQWPKETRLELDAPRLRIGRNEAFEVSGRVFGVIPPQATVVFKLDGINPTEHACEIVLSEDGKQGSFRTRLDPGKVVRDFLFQVRAHDAVTDWFHVTVLPPPLLVPLQGKASPQVRLQFPVYTDLPEQQLPEGSGNVEAVAGTIVTLRAAANRPLKAAWIDFQPEPRGAEAALFLAPLGSIGPLGTLADLVAGGSVWDRVPATLEAENRELAVTFRPTVSGTYALHFVDETGLPNSRLFELKIFPDPAPTVTLERPSASRDALTVLPDATLNLQAVAEDAQFALRSVFVEYRCKKTDPPRRLPLFDHHEAARQLEQGFALLHGGPADAPPPRSRLPRLPVSRALALKELRHLDPKDGGLKDGDVLTLQVCADDFDDLSVDKQPGRSHEIEVRIVSRNALDLMVNQAQAKVREDLLKLREMQREAIKKVTEAQAQLKQAGQLKPEEANKLTEAENLQQQIRERVGNRQEGLRSEVGRILDMLRDNHLPRTAAEERMEAVDRELERLARDELNQIEPRLTNARKQSERPEAGKPVPQEQKARELEQSARQKEQAAAEAEKAGEKEKADALRQEAQSDRQKAQEMRRAAEKAKAAAERERQAQEHERAAEQQEKAAAEAEKAGDTKKAQQAKQQAEAERQKAAEKRQEAEKEAKSDPQNTRQLLKEARQHQEEVEKTLNDMLSRLEPWASTQEVKGEAKALLEEQRRLQRQTEEMQQKELRGLKPEEQADHRANLEKAQAEQQKLEERARQLLDTMDRLAQERKEKDPQTAKELEEAARQGRDSNVPGMMQEARERLQQSQLGQASEKQQQSARELEKLVKTLEDRREAELDRLIKKMKEQEKALEELQQEQERLKKKRKEAEAIADPKKREEELQRLAREQEQLQKKAEEMAKQLSRQREERGSQAMRQAAEQMREASRQMQQGQNAEENQDEALDRLAEAREEMQAAREEAEEELAREQLAKVADEIRRLKERQEALIGEAERIQREMLQKRPEEWRGLLISLGRLAEAQGLREMGLARELSNIAEKKLDAAPVFARVLRKTAEAMEKASQRFLEHRDEARDTSQAETAPGKEALAQQKDALRRLTQLLETLKQAQAAPQGGGGGGGGGGQGGGAGGGGGDGIPPIAQLKLLRELQVEVNRRTEEFRARHPDLTRLDDKARAELLEIRKEQQELAELLEDYIGPGEPEGEKP